MRAGMFDDRERYAAYLGATHRAREPLERALDQAGAEQLFAMWPRRKIAAALRADIADLSGEAVVESSPPSAPVPKTPAQMLGILYVLEGSALGARLLIRRAEAMGMSSSFGARHLASQTDTPSAWASFVAVLDAAEMDSEQEAECTAAAIATFAVFEAAVGEAAG